jgi:hypothetical protein
MPWLEQPPSGVFHVVFRFGGRKCKRSLKTKSELRAKAACSRLEDNLGLLERGLLDIPAGADLAEFLLTDGKSHGQRKLPPSMPLGQLFDEYLQSIPDDSLEPQTLYVANIHIGHLKKAFWKHFSVHRLTEDDLQHYVIKRTKSKGRRGRPISTVTIKKELSTLRTLWNWARQRRYVSGDFPSRSLKFPKTADNRSF